MCIVCRLFCRGLSVDELVCASALGHTAVAHSTFQHPFFIHSVICSLALANKRISTFFFTNFLSPRHISTHRTHIILYTFGMRGRDSRAFCFHRLTAYSSSSVALFRLYYMLSVMFFVCELKIDNDLKMIFKAFFVSEKSQKNKRKITSLWI